MRVEDMTPKQAHELLASVTGQSAAKGKHLWRQIHPEAPAEAKAEEAVTEEKGRRMAHSAYIGLEGPGRQRQERAGGTAGRTLDAMLTQETAAQSDRSPAAPDPPRQ